MSKRDYMAFWAQGYRCGRCEWRGREDKASDLPDSALHGDAFVAHENGCVVGTDDDRACAYWRLGYVSGALSANGPVNVAAQDYVMPE